MLKKIVRELVYIKKELQAIRRCLEYRKSRYVPMLEIKEGLEFKTRKNVSKTCSTLPEDS